MTGFFDPLGLSQGVSPNTFKRWRESELKHGRLAMIASIAIITSEAFHPLWNGVVDGPATSHMTQMENIIPGFWLYPTFFTAIAELTSISKGWAPFSETKGTLAWLKDDYTPVSQPFSFPISITRRPFSLLANTKHFSVRVTSVSTPWVSSPQIPRNSTSCVPRSCRTVVLPCSQLPGSSHRS